MQRVTPWTPERSSTHRQSTSPPVDQNSKDNDMTRPNIIMILADDMGFSDIGCYGGEIPTPNIDELASRGTRMTQYYTTPRCSPSRAAFLTGRHPHETGIGVLTENDGPEGYPGSIDPSIPTVAQRLKDAGYRTCLAGKWHLAADVDEPNDSWPTRCGFDDFYGVLAGTVSYYQPRTLMRGEERIDHEPFDDDDFYTTDTFTDHAESFVRGSEDAEQPFFLYLAYTAPHWPLQARDADIEQERGRFDEGWDVLRARRLERQVELGVLPADQALSARDPHESAWTDVDDKAWEARRMEVYSAQLRSMDRGIGRIVEALRSTGQLDDTIIVFASDNGGCAEELPAGPNSFLEMVPTICPPKTKDDRPVTLGNEPGVMPGREDTYQSYGRAWANLSNTPFRLYKRWVHEGGIASPLVVSWPNGDLAPGLVPGEGHIIDLLPTMLDAAGVELADDRLTGVSLLPTWRKDATGRSERSLFWEHVGNAAVRRGRWKLVKEYDLPWELYDIEADRAELVDLAERHPDVVAELDAEWRAWAQRSGVVPWERMLDLGFYRFAYPPAVAPQQAPDA